MPKVSRSSGSRKPWRRSTRKRPKRLLKLVDALDDDDDVQNVFTNADISDEVMAAAGVTKVRIIGIDPGLRNTGWGVIEAEGTRLSYVADGSVHSRCGCAAGHAAAANSHPACGHSEELLAG